MTSHRASYRITIGGAVRGGAVFETFALEKWAKLSDNSAEGEMSTKCGLIWNSLKP